jgi:hypothetical protein
MYITFGYVHKRVRYNYRARPQKKYKEKKSKQTNKHLLGQITQTQKNKKTHHICLAEYEKTTRRDELTTTTNCCLCLKFSSFHIAQN